MGAIVRIAEPEPPKERTRLNSLADIATTDLSGFGGNPFEPTISTPAQFIHSADYNVLTLNRIALTYGFKTYGLVRSVITQPVDDAFRGGLEISIPEIDDPEAIALLKDTMEENDDLAAIREAGYWARLFGGSGLIAVTEQDPSTPLNERALSGKQLRFLAAERWELILSGIDRPADALVEFETRQYAFAGIGDMNYYGVPLDNSRVSRMLGQRAPALIRQRLQGWGLSELEQCMREIQTYIKLQNLCYELVDEAKIDVYKIQQFNTQLATAEGTAAIKLRMQLANLIKNYKNALVMDAEDDYQQKQLTFSGLADILVEFRTNLCAALKFPMNKLFGMSATGFSSGEDSMENYNSMIDVEVRDRIKKLVRRVIELRCWQLFGYLPKFTFSFQPLRVLSGVEDETVKTSEQNRTLDLFDRDLITGQEASEILKKCGLLEIDTEVSEGTREPEPKAGFGADPEPQPAASGGKKDNRRENALDRLRGLLPLRRAA